MISYQEKQKIFKKCSKIVYYVYYHKIGGLKSVISKDEEEDLLQEGMLELARVLNTFEPREDSGYDSKEFTSYAIQCIHGTMLRYFTRKSSIFKISDRAFEEKYREQTMQLLRGSFSMDMKISDDADSDEFSSLFVSETNDYEDALFYTELKSFLKLIPEEERCIMQFYYYACIDLMDEKQATKSVARQFNISTPAIKKITSRWNPELYAFLKAEKGSIESFHDSFCSDNNQILQDAPHHGTVRMIKDGKMLRVNSDMMDEYIARGWNEYSVDCMENRRCIWINNGEVTFAVRSEDVPLFEKEGFVLGKGKRGKCIIKRIGATLKISKGERIEEISENFLKYWESIGFSVCERGSNKGYVHIWKGTKVTAVSKDDAQQYLDDGWSLGSGKVLLGSLDGEKRKVSMGELPKYLSENWIPLRTSSTPRIKDPTMTLINYDGLIEAYVEKSKLELYLSHGWKEGTAFISVFVPNAPNRTNRYRRVVLSGNLQKYLGKGYTL